MCFARSDLKNIALEKKKMLVWKLKLYDPMIGYVVNASDLRDPILKYSYWERESKGRIKKIIKIIKK